MDPRTADPVGQVSVRANDPTTRRGTPRQERSPFDLWPTVTAVTADFVRGTILRIPDLRSRHANIRQAAHRPAPRRVVATHPAHHQRPRTWKLPAPALDHPLLGARVKDAYGVAARSTTSILDPITHPRS